jgi:hypothetical protein
LASNVMPGTGGPPLPAAGGQENTKREFGIE